MPTSVSRLSRPGGEVAGLRFRIWGGCPVALCVVVVKKEREDGRKCRGELGSTLRSSAACTGVPFPSRNKWDSRDKIDAASLSLSRLGVGHGAGQQATTVGTLAEMSLDGAAHTQAYTPARACETIAGGTDPTVYPIVPGGWSATYGWIWRCALGQRTRHPLRQAGSSDGKPAGSVVQFGGTVRSGGTRPYGRAGGRSCRAGAALSPPSKTKGEWRKSRGTRQRASYLSVLFPIFFVGVV